MSSCEHRVVVVEDDAALAESLAATLGDRHQVHVGGTAEEGIHLIEIHRPEVVILDLNLPDGDAFDVLDAVGRGSPTPAVVVMSGVATPGDAFRLAECGAGCFLSKPFTVDQLLEAVDQVLTRPVSLGLQARHAVGQRPVHDLQEEVRSTMVHEALARSQGNVRRAASLLGISRQLLQHMARKYIRTE
jgi:DNA-binding NtrC family response regulator